MKIVSTKKVKTIWYQINYNTDDESYVLEYYIRKILYLTFFGIPFFPKMLIYVRPNELDIKSYEGKI